MRDLRRYWRDVREMERVLPEYVWIVNVEGGDPVEASAAIAAPLLHGNSHRLATEEEVRARQAAQVASNREAAREDLRRRGIAVVAIH